MTQGKLLEFLEDIGISISAGYLSNLLIKNHGDFESEKSEVYASGLNQKQLADRLGMNQSTISRYLNKSIIKLLEAIARISHLHVAQPAINYIKIIDILLKTSLLEEKKYF